MIVLLKEKENLNKTKMHKALTLESFLQRKTFHFAFRFVFSLPEITVLCNCAFSLISKSISWFVKDSWTSQVAQL